MRRGKEPLPVMRKVPAESGAQVRQRNPEAWIGCEASWTVGFIAKGDVADQIRGEETERAGDSAAALRKDEDVANKILRGFSVVWCVCVHADGFDGDDGARQL